MRRNRAVKDGLLRVFQESSDEPDDCEGYDNGRIGRELAIGWIRERQHARGFTGKRGRFQFQLGSTR